jgi:hypothetical protein
MAVAPITNENHCPNNMSHHVKRKDSEHILLTIFDKELQSSVFFKYFLYLCRHINNINKH